MLRALSFNVRRALKDDGPDAWGRRRDQVASVLRFHAPAVVALQEALPGQLRDLRDRLDYEWVGRPRAPADEHTPVGYDPARLTLLDEATFWLSDDGPHTTGWDGAHPRVATWARLRDRDTDHEWLVVSTHLDHRGERARREGARLLADRIPALARPTEAPADHRSPPPTVLLGDFNSSPGSPPYRRLAGETPTITSAGAAWPGVETGTSDGADGDTSPAPAPFRDARAVADVVHGPSGTFHDFEGAPGARIDHVFVGPGVSVTRFGTLTDHCDRYPSDHFPILTDLQVDDPAGPRHEPDATQADVD